MKVVFVSSDLMGAAIVEAAAKRSGAAFRQVGTINAASELCVAERVMLVVVDLATAGLDVARLVAQLPSGSEDRPAIVAFGPHVHAAALQAARDAGCDEVFTRGQFMAQADAIVARHATPPQGLAN